ncbi:bifunctional DNA-directed RNA polymerase [Babesia duncani]|uniref:Bifunctional DNA-directed RNA polymerase n=1 Tax=Babesia duncani TaxID=323732 RepID=A0AAD9UMT8_9APIC|nr:bifunctional DNA-directed RNA polymerase [Babesia duncani]
MTRQMPSMNRPEAADMVELAPGVKRVEWIPDTRFPLCGIRLLRDDRVSFVGYRVPHPLENKLELRVRTKTDTPFIVVLNAISSVKNNLAYLRKTYLGTNKTQYPFILGLHEEYVNQSVYNSLLYL